MVLAKLPVPGRPTSLDKSRARAYCTCSRCGWWLFGHFYSHLSFLFPFSYLWETTRYKLKYCLKGSLSQKQPPIQPTFIREIGLIVTCIYCALISALRHIIHVLL